MTVTVKDYGELKKNFFEKHENEFRIETSPMDEYGRYHKEYVFNDGAVWYQVMGPEYVNQEVTVKGCTMNVEFKMFRTEFWNTDDFKSKFCYEKF